MLGVRESFETPTRFPNAMVPKQACGHHGHMSRRMLPDPDAARQQIRAAVPQLGHGLARQARAHADSVQASLSCGSLRSPTRQADAIKLLQAITGGTSTNSNHESWECEVNVHIIYRGIFYGYDDPNRRDPTGIGKAFQPVNLPDLYRLSPNELRDTLRDLHRALTALVASLPTSMPAPLLLPVRHPPAFARLREDVAADSVAERLTSSIELGLELFEAAKSQPWPGSESGPRAYHQLREPLYAFLTGEIPSRYQEATRGFEEIELLPHATHYGARRTSRLYREIAADIHPRIYSGYVAIAVNYLAEVLDHMPEYAEASGQGMRRDPVTVYGNVGAINSEVHHSNLNVAETLVTIGTNMRVISERGQNDVATAFNALAEAIQSAPGLADELRTQLLDNLADVAEAATTPNEPRKLSRAKAAIAAITSAAGASAQLAQAISTWHSVLGMLF